MLRLAIVLDGRHRHRISRRLLRLGRSRKQRGRARNAHRLQLVFSHLHPVEKLRRFHIHGTYRLGFHQAVRIRRRGRIGDGNERVILQRLERQVVRPRLRRPLIATPKRLRVLPEQFDKHLKLGRLRTLNAHMHRARRARHLVDVGHRRADGLVRRGCQPQPVS